MGKIERQKEKVKAVEDEIATLQNKVAGWQAEYGRLQAAQALNPTPEGAAKLESFGGFLDQQAALLPSPARSTALGVALDRERDKLEVLRDQKAQTARVLTARLALAAEWPDIVDLLKAARAIEAALGLRWARAGGGVEIRAVVSRLGDIYAKVSSVERLKAAVAEYGED